MAEGLLRHEAGDRFEVYSAGTKPSIVRKEAIAAMSEIGIDISGHRSKSVDEFAGHDLDYVITVCDNAKESCPVFPAKTLRMHWPFQDPAAVKGTNEERRAAFLTVRDQNPQPHHGVPRGREVLILGSTSSTTVIETGLDVTVRNGCSSTS